ncbi:MAG: DUF1850 domain-containing protein [Armatimonadetes bacterium]|nr:DUF1850 domain-containing protein [Armatimonadota bacterium]
MTRRAVWQRWVVAGVVVAAAILLVERAGTELRVTEPRSGRVLWRARGTPGDLIELRYLHSVERTPIVEVFRADADGMWLVMMRFTSQGAGLPTEGYTREGGEFVLRTNRRVGALQVRVSEIAGHQLIAGRERVDLVVLAGDGALVSLESSAAPLRLRGPAR